MAMEALRVHATIMQGIPTESVEGKDIQLSLMEMLSQKDVVKALDVDVEDIVKGISHGKVNLTDKLFSQ
jgi:hypothetical protein